MKRIDTLLRIIFLLALVSGYGQKIGIPQLDFEYACISDGYNTFNATFTFDEKPFEADNVFYVELSDKDGSFNNPTTLKTIEGENYSFEFTAGFSFPEAVAGEQYKIRLRSTSPAITGTPTPVFDAYYVPSETIVLNDYKDLSLCGGGTATMQLDKDIADEYVWYKNGEIYKLTEENSIEITEAGEYYVEPYYGNCTGSIYSNLVIVNTGEAFNVSILGNKSFDACKETNIVLQASVDNENYTYAWFKDETKIEGISTYMPKLELETKVENYGSYRLEVTNEGGCTSSSDVVSIEQNKETVVEATSPLHAVIIGDNTATLAIKTNSDKGIISWYKNGQMLKEGYNSSSLSVSEEGSYYAEVTSDSECEGVVKSETFKIYEPQSYTVQIDHNDAYAPCLTASAEVSVSKIKGTLSNGDHITISEDFYHNFNMKWLKDGVVAGEGVEISLNYKQNGTYQLQLTYKENTFSSNTIKMTLGLPDTHLTVEKALSCTEGRAQLKVNNPIEGATYKWYRDGALIVTNDQNNFSTSDEGTYQVEVSYGGCALTTEEVELYRNTDDLIEVYPGEEVTIGPNGIIQANATGGDSYEWLDEEGKILSTTSTFTIQEEGTYTLQAKVGTCTVEKTVQVNANNVVEIPNIVSPNNDTINDKWTLPQKLINDPDTEVIICDAYGSTVLKTNSYDNSWPSSSTNFSSETPVFYYFINKKGKNIKKGSITLVN